MPLHLLGKKSWNVYNQDNIARVHRDEAEAEAREEERNRRMQEVDSERRIQLLKGEKVAALPPEDPSIDDRDPRGKVGNEHTHSRKRRRLAGEDDTDRDMRYAMEDAIERSSRAGIEDRVTINEPVTDSTGHINLIPIEYGRKQEKNVEAETEKARRNRELEDQYTMRFSNAAGFKQTLGDPWYSSIQASTHVQDLPGKDVWGNEDPMRREREKARLDTNDPLSAMKRGVKQLREVERSRRDWVDERRRDIAELDQEDRERKRRKHHQRHTSDRDNSARGSQHRYSRDESNSRDRDREKGRSRHRRSHHRSKDPHRRHRNPG